MRGRGTLAEDEQYFCYTGVNYAKVLLNLCKIHNYFILLYIQVPCVQFQCFKSGKSVKLVLYFNNFVWLELSLKTGT